MNPFSLPCFPYYITISIVNNDGNSFLFIEIKRRNTLITTNTNPNKITLIEGKYEKYKFICGEIKHSEKCDYNQTTFF